MLISHYLISWLLYYHKVLKKSKQDSKQCSGYSDDSDDNKESFAISILKESNMKVINEMSEWAKHVRYVIVDFVGGPRNKTH